MSIYTEMLTDSEMGGAPRILPTSVKKIRFFGSALTMAKKTGVKVISYPDTSSVRAPC